MNHTLSQSSQLLFHLERTCSLQWQRTIFGSSGHPPITESAFCAVRTDITQILAKCLKNRFLLWKMGKSSQVGGWIEKYNSANANVNAVHQTSEERPWTCTFFLNFVANNRLMVANSLIFICWPVLLNCLWFKQFFINVFWRITDLKYFSLFRIFLKDSLLHTAFPLGDGIPWSYNAWTILNKLAPSFDIRKISLTTSASLSLITNYPCSLCIAKHFLWSYLESGSANDFCKPHLISARLNSLSFYT